MQNLIWGTRRIAGFALDFAVNPIIVRFLENPNQPYRDDAPAPAEEGEESRMTRKVIITYKASD